jgi:hypothetical protein
MQFLGFSNHEKGALRQEILKWSMVCSMFLRSGWSVVSASHAKGGTSKKRLSLHLHRVPTQGNKVSPWTLQMALTCINLLFSGHHYCLGFWLLAVFTTVLLLYNDIFILYCLIVLKAWF